MIVESQAKAETIKKDLGSGFVVQALVRHIPLLRARSRSRSHSPLSLMIRCWVEKSTHTSPKRRPKPSFHSKLSKKDHTKKAVSAAPASMARPAARRWLAKK